MKNVLLVFCNGDITEKAEYIGKISKVFANGGFPFDKAEILTNDDDILFLHSLERYKDLADNLVIVNGENLTFNPKQIIAQVVDTTLMENENAKRLLDSVSERHGKVYDDDYARLPLDATVIPNIDGAEQGFMLDDKDFTLIYLPSEIGQATSMGERYVLPFFENKYGVKVKKLVLKYFGDEKLLCSTIENSINKWEKACNWFSEENNGDFKVTFNFTPEGNNLSSPVIREVVEKLKDNIYAEFDTTLKERLFHLIRLKNNKIAKAESFTGGKVVSDIISNVGAPQHVVEGIVCYSNKSKMQRLFVDSADLNKNGAVSSIVAYQMAAGLLRNGNCDLAIATTGFAGPNFGEENKAGLCYIAVGMKDGVHTYKYEFSGSREKITEKAKNTALFLAIKKLKKL